MNKLIGPITALALLGIAPSVAAQQGAPAQPAAQRGSLDEIVVSASRRDERLQDVPIAITALGQEELDRREITGVADLQSQTPGLVYAHVTGMAQITMRGVGTDLYSVAAEPGVAIYMDDMYIARTFMSHAAMVELERVEILRGPQGTLYGRNTSGGAIKFITKQPSAEFEAEGAVQYGGYDQFQGRASLTGPIFSDRLRARLSIFAEDREGWTKNLAGGDDLEAHRALSGRLAVVGDVTDNINIGLTLERQEQVDTGPTLHGLTPVIGTALSDSAALPLLAPFDVTIAQLEANLGFALEPIFDALVDQAGGGYSPEGHEIYNDFPPYAELETTGITGTLGWDLGFANFKAIGGYRDNERDLSYDTDGSDLPLLRFNPYYQQGRQYSLELQLMGPGENRLN
ncbi:MAG: TonB-dependent receptor [Alphaproteobacteria bacterium]